MVDKKIIEKIITKTITYKCRRNKIPIRNNKYQIRLNQKARKAINNFTEKVKGESKEYLLIIDKGGNTVFEKNGNDDGVSISLTDEDDEYLKTLKTVDVDAHVKKGDYIVIHNHPVHNADSIESEDVYKNILPPCFSFSDINTLRNQDFCKTSIVVSSDNGYKMMLSLTDDFFNSFTDAGPWSESEYMGNVFGNPFQLQDTYFDYIEKLQDTTKNIIEDDTDNNILKSIFDKGYSTPNNILNEYEKLAIKEAGSFEEELSNLRSFFNDNGVELSIEAD